MASDKPLVNKKYKLEKFQGKGGWTFARIPDIKMNKKIPFGMLRVRGSIDGVAFSAAHLMPQGQGGLFLPVKAEIRKKIKKEEGDTVHIVLYEDKLPTEIPDELRLCLSDEPIAHKAFMALSNGEKKAQIEWIYAAKNESTRADRMARMINQLAGIQLHID